MGQIGVHVSQRLHVGLPPYGRVLRADGITETRKSLVSTQLFTFCSVYDSGIPGIGYGNDCTSSAYGLGSPATPMARSASQ